MGALEEGANTKRKASFKLVAMQLFLRRMYMVCRRAMRRQQGGVIHLSLDAARVGGRDAEIGVLYHTGSGIVVWMPPIVQA